MEPIAEAMVDWNTEGTVLILMYGNEHNRPSEHQSMHDQKSCVRALFGFSTASVRLPALKI